MTRRLDYKWNLRQVMAGRGMFATTDLIGPLADREIRLSSSQVYRLVAERPERLSLKVLMALLDILDCSLEDLIEPAAEPGTAARRKKKAAGAEAGIGGPGPPRARLPGPPVTVNPPVPHAPRPIPPGRPPARSWETGSGPAPHPPEQVDHFAAGQVRPERDVPGHVGHPPVQGGHLPPRVAAQQPGRPGVGTQQAEQDAQGRCLAGAVRAQEPVHFPLGHGQIEAVQRPCPAEVLPQASHFNCHRHDSDPTLGSENSEVS